MKSFAPRWVAACALGELNARVIVLTGIYHRRGVVDPDDPHFERRPYSMAAANAQAQRARVLFASSLAARRPELFVAAVHPGAVRTAALDRAPLWPRALAATLAAPAFVRPEVGAIPALRLATMPREGIASGRFWDRFTLTPDAPTAAERRAAEALFAARPA